LAGQQHHFHLALHGGAPGLVVLLDLFEMGHEIATAGNHGLGHLVGLGAGRHVGGEAALVGVDHRVESLLLGGGDIGAVGHQMPQLFDALVHLGHIGAVVAQLPVLFMAANGQQQDLEILVRHRFEFRVQIPGRVHEVAHEAFMLVVALGALDGGQFLETLAVGGQDGQRRVRLVVHGLVHGA